MAAFVSACGGSGEPAVPAAAISDSAGVRMVTYELSGDSLAAYATVGAHDLEIGVRDGAAEYTFAGISGVRSLSDGTIVVADGQSLTLRWFEPDGAFVRSAGGEGGGPGEFGSLNGIVGLSGDTVFAFDARNRRVTAFDREGALAGVSTLSIDGAGRPIDVRRMDDGSFVAITRWIAPGAAFAGPHDFQLELDSVVVQRLDPVAQVADTLRVLRDREWMRRITAEGGRVTVTASLRPLGNGAVIRTDGRDALIGVSSRWEIERVDVTGRRTGLLRVLGADRPATQSDVELYMRTAGDPDPAALRQRMSIFEDVPLPERLPSFSHFVVDDLDRVWVAEYEPDLSGTQWTVFAGDGTLLGSVTVPERFTPFEMNEGSLLGVFRDDFDVPFVRRYPLVPADD